MGEIMTDINNGSNDEASTSPPTPVLKPKEVDTSRFVTDLRPFDVLLGRGTGPNNNQGNVAFREAVEKLKNDYVSTPSRKTKNRIVRRTVEAVKAKNGRFLSKLRKSEIKMLGLPFKEAYEIASDDIAIEKTKQALRYVCYKKDGPSRSDSPDSFEIERPTKMIKNEEGVAAAAMYGTGSNASRTPDEVAAQARQRVSMFSDNGLPVTARETAIQSGIYGAGLSSAAQFRSSVSSLSSDILGSSYPSMVNPVAGLSSLSSPMLPTSTSGRLLAGRAASSILSDQSPLSSLYGSQQLIRSSFPATTGSVQLRPALPISSTSLPAASVIASPMDSLSSFRTTNVLPHSLRTQQMINAIKDEQLLALLRDKQMRDELMMRQERSAAAAMLMRQESNVARVAELQQQQDERYRRNMLPRMGGYLG